MHICCDTHAISEDEGRKLQYMKSLRNKNNDVVGRRIHSMYHYRSITYMNLMYWRQIVNLQSNVVHSSQIIIITFIKDVGTFCVQKLIYMIIPQKNVGKCCLIWISMGNTSLLRIQQLNSNFKAMLFILLANSCLLFVYFVADQENHEWLKSMHALYWAIRKILRSCGNIHI